MGDRLHLNRENSYNVLERNVLPEICAKPVTPGLDCSEDESVTRQVMIDFLKVMYNSSRWEDRFGAI